MLCSQLYSFRVIGEDFGVVALEFVGQLLTGFRGEGLPDDGRHTTQLGTTMNIKILLKLWFPAARCCCHLLQTV